MTLQEATERAQLLLGAVSLLLWFAVAYALSVTWLLDGQPRTRVMLAGAIALAVAAVPWVVYGPLVRRFSKTRPNRENR